MVIMTKVAIARAAGSKESPYGNRDKLMVEHCISLHARRAKKAVKAVDSADRPSVLAIGAFSKDGASWSESSQVMRASRKCRRVSPKKVERVMDMVCEIPSGVWAM